MKNSVFNRYCTKFLGGWIESKTLPSGITYYYYKTPKNGYLNMVCGYSKEEAWEKFAKSKYADFHKNWGSIMKVVDAIEKKGGEVTMNKVSSTIKFFNTTYEVTASSKKRSCN